MNLKKLALLAFEGLMREDLKGRFHFWKLGISIVIVSLFPPSPYAELNAVTCSSLAPGSALKIDLEHIVGLIAHPNARLNEVIRILEAAQQMWPDTFSDDFKTLSDLLVNEYMQRGRPHYLGALTNSSITRFFRRVFKSVRLSQVHHLAAKGMARYLDVRGFLKHAESFRGSIIAPGEEGDFRLIEDLAFMLRWAVSPKTNRVFLGHREVRANYQGKVVDALFGFKQAFLKEDEVDSDVDLKTIKAIFSEYERQRRERVTFKALLAKVCTTTPWQEPLAHRELYRRYGKADGRRGFTDGTLIVERDNNVTFFGTQSVKAQGAEVGESLQVRAFPVEDGIPVIEVYSKVSPGRLVYEGYYNKRLGKFRTPFAQFRLWFKENEPPMPWKSVPQMAHGRNGRIVIFKRGEGQGVVKVEVGKGYHEVWKGAQQAEGHKFLVVKDAPEGNQIRRFVWDGHDFPLNIFYAWMDESYEGKVKGQLRINNLGQGVLSQHKGKDLVIRLGDEYKNKGIWWKTGIFQYGENKEMRIDIYPNEEYKATERIDFRYYHPDQNFLFSPNEELKKRFWEWDPTRPPPSPLLVRVGARNRIMLRGLSQQMGEGRLWIILPRYFSLDYKNVLFEFVQRNLKGSPARGLRIYSLDPSGWASLLIYDRYYDPEEDKMIGQINIRKELAQQEQAALQLEAWLWGHLPPPQAISDKVSSIDENLKVAEGLIKGLSLGRILLSTSQESEAVINEAKKALGELRRQLAELIFLQRREPALVGLERYTSPIDKNLSALETNLVNLERLHSKFKFDDFLKVLGGRKVFYQGQFGLIKGQDTIELKVDGGVIEVIEVEGLFRHSRGNGKFLVFWRNRGALMAATDEELKAGEREYISSELISVVRDYQPRYITEGEKSDIIQGRMQPSGRNKRLLESSN